MKPHLDMLYSPHVANLIRLPGSGIVLVNACGDRSQTGPVSPISYTSASLVQALRKSQPKAVVLVFFCGRHVAGEDPLRGPQGMVRSLLAQLVFSMLQKGWVEE